MIEMVTKEKKDLKKQVNIAFIVQMSEIWDKEEPVYQAMKENHYFSADIIVVPKFDFDRPIINLITAVARDSVGLYKIKAKRPFESFRINDNEIEKFHEVLAKGVGLKIVAIADHDTPFQTIRVPEAGDFKPYVMLCAGWNLLVEIGLATGINLDKPERARKVGNELIL